MNYVKGFLEHVSDGKLVLTGEPHQIEAALRETTIPYVRINWDAMSPQKQVDALKLVLDTPFTIPVVITATDAGAQTIPTAIRNKMTNLKAQEKK